MHGSARPARGAPPPLVRKSPPASENEGVPERTFLRPPVPRGRTRAFVLMYHNFSNHPARENTSARSLRRQLGWISRNVDVVSTSELATFLEGHSELPERVVVITIDDGLRTAYTTAFPILRDLGLRFTLALPTRVIDSWHEEKALEWPQVREMLATGLCEIASHGVTHEDLTRLEPGEIDEELEASRDLIEQRTGFRPEAFVYPFGNHSPLVRRRTREAGYRLAYGIGETRADAVVSETPRWRVPRVHVDHSTSPARLARFFRLPAVPAGRVSRP